MAIKNTAIDINEKDGTDFVIRWKSLLLVPGGYDGFGGDHSVLPLPLSLRPFVSVAPYSVQTKIAFYRCHTAHGSDHLMSTGQTRDGAFASGAKLEGG